MQDNFYYTSYKDSGIKPYKIIFLSTIVTLTLYLLIPLIDQMRMSECDLDLKEIQLVKLSHFEHLEQKTVNPEKKYQREQLKLIKPGYKYQTIPIDVSFDTDITISKIDFFLDFSVQSEMNVDDFIFELNDVDLEPEPLLQSPPFYPLQAKSRGIEGEVVLMFIVNTEGLVEHVEVISSKNGEYFIESAISAVKRWKFKPGKYQGEVVPVRVQLPLSFDLNH